MDNEDGRNSGTTQTPHFANLPVASLPAPAGWNCFVHGPVGIFLVRSDRVIALVGRGLAWMTNVQWYQMRARPLGCRDGKFTPPPDISNPWLQLQSAAEPLRLRLHTSGIYTAN